MKQLLSLITLLSLSSLSLFAQEADAAIVQVNLNYVWTIVAACMVFFMQAGFTLVETGFTRAKNALNIVMKNVMDVSAGGDMYFELGYSGAAADVFLGAGDGWHSGTGDFGIVNIGVTKSKEIKITDSFSLPIRGAVIFNPDSEQLYILSGISL